jgi:hypothetical protein
MANEKSGDIQKRTKALEEIIESSKKMQEKAQKTLDELKKKAEAETANKGKK